jgi:hypothetical protein
METQDRKLTNLLNEVSVMADFLRQQVESRRITELLYVQKIEKFIKAYNEYSQK